MSNTPQTPYKYIACSYTVIDTVGDDMITFNRINAEFTNSLNTTIISKRFSLLQLDSPLCDTYGKMMDMVYVTK